MMDALGAGLPAVHGGGPARFGLVEVFTLRQGSRTVRYLVIPIPENVEYRCLSKSIGCFGRGTLLVTGRLSINLSSPAYRVFVLLCAVSDSMTFEYR